MEVVKVIQSFLNKYSNGYDETPIVKIKEVKSEVLAYLINSSLVISTLPGNLKVAKFIPIHTKNDEHDLSNFRPCSILPTISKIYKTTVNNQFLSFFGKL